MSEKELININGTREDLYQAMQIGDITLSSKHSQELYDFMNYQDKEIERLNNIINEFDRYIDEIIAERIEKMEGTRFLKGGFTIEQNYLKRRLHERLQELKGNNKDITEKSDCNYEKVGKEQNNVI